MMLFHFYLLIKKASQVNVASEYQIFENELSFKLILGSILLLSDLGNPHLDSTASR